MGFTAESAPSGRSSLFLLALILVAYLALGSAYALNTPLWQAPDEPAHFNYVRDLALGKGIPVLQMGDYNFDYMAKIEAAHFPPDMSIDSIRYESHQPPLYYSLEALVYWSVEGRSLAQQVFSLRLFSLLLEALCVAMVYRATRQIFPGQPNLALGVASLVAFIPQHLHLSGSIDNDVLGELLLTAILLVLLVYMQPARQVRSTSRQPSGAAHWPVRTAGTAVPPDSVALPASGTRDPANRAAEVSETPIWRIVVPLGVLLGLALLAKTTSYVAVPLVPLGLALRERLRGEFSWSRLISTTLASYGVALAVSGWWFVRNIETYGGLDIFGLTRHDQVVVGQPRVGVFDWAAASRFVTVGFQSFWAQFGWMGVPSDSRTYAFAGIFSLLAIAGFAVFLVRQVRRPSLTAYQAASLVLLAAAFLLVLIGVVTYNLEFIQPQGRYVFPALLPIGVFALLGLRQFMGRHPAVPVALLSLFLFVLAVYNLWRVLIPGFRY